MINRRFVCVGCSKRWTTSSSPQVLPFMPAFICKHCESSERTYREDEIANKRFAKWKSDEVKSLAGYQQSDSFLPFICERLHVLEATLTGLHCSDCNFWVKWAYDWTLDWSWKKLDDSGGTGVRVRNPSPHPLGDISIALEQPDLSSKETSEQ